MEAFKNFSSFSCPYRCETDAIISKHPADGDQRVLCVPAKAAGAPLVVTSWARPIRERIQYFYHSKCPKASQDLSVIKHIKSVWELLAIYHLSNCWGQLGWDGGGCLLLCGSFINIPGPRWVLYDYTGKYSVKSGFKLTKCANSDQRLLAWADGLNSKTQDAF